MKTTREDNGVIRFHYNIFDKIALWVLRKTVWRFERWIRRKPFYKKLYHILLPIVIAEFVRV